MRVGGTFPVFWLNHALAYSARESIPPILSSAVVWMKLMNPVPLYVGGFYFRKRKIFPSFFSLFRDCSLMKAPSLSWQLTRSDFFGVENNDMWPQRTSTKNFKKNQQCVCVCVWASAEEGRTFFFLLLSFILLSALSSDGGDCPRTF